MPSLIDKMTTADVFRLFSGIEVKSDDECWEWKRMRHTDGYGRINIKGFCHNAQRVSYSVRNGEIPDGLIVRHTCDNPPCCNPAHLLIGTNLDNVRDREERGRTARGDRSGLRVHPERAARGERSGSRLHPESRPRGENHFSKTKPWLLARGDANGSRKHPEKLKRGEDSPRAKITEQDVRDIRLRHSNGETQQALSIAFGLGKSMVGYIVRKQNWKHVE